MRRRHKQGNFWWFCTFLACPGAVRRFAELSRDCAWLWLIVGCHRVNSNFNLSHAVDFNSSAFRGGFRLKTEICDGIFCSFNFLGSLSANGMRSMWEFVFVSQFLRVFQGKFGFVRFTAEVRIKTIVCFKENTKSYETRLIFHLSRSFRRCRNFKRDLYHSCWLNSRFNLRVVRLLLVLEFTLSSTVDF